MTLDSCFYLVRQILKIIFSIGEGKRFYLLLYSIALRILLLWSLNLPVLEHQWMKANLFHLISFNYCRIWMYVQMDSSMDESERVLNWLEKQIELFHSQPSISMFYLIRVKVKVSYLFHWPFSGLVNSTCNWGLTVHKGWTGMGGERV